jgi:hypothetical protein
MGRTLQQNAGVLVVFEKNVSKERNENKTKTERERGNNTRGGKRTNSQQFKLV